MRQAFRWVYENLDQGVSFSLSLRRSKGQGRLRSSLEEARTVMKRLQKFDAKYLKESECSLLLGVDEVGRGPLAGPLVACCVQLPYPAPVLPFLRDSKKLKAEERERLASQLEKEALQVSYGVVEAEEFGLDLNLHQLTFLAMYRAVRAMTAASESSALLVDGKFPLPQWTGPQRAVIKGDDTSLSIAAASVLAKVYRDRVMAEIHREFPQYGFDKHVGYGTEAHRQAISEHGACPHHRRNFLTRILGGSGKSLGEAPSHDSKMSEMR